MASLEDFVNQLSNPAPVYEDPEDDIGDGTNAQLAINEAELAEDGALSERPQSSHLRRRAAPYLEADPRYQGQKTSRKDLYEFGDDVEDDEDNDEGVGDSESGGSDQKEDGEDSDNDVEDDDDDDDDDEEEETSRDGVVADEGGDSDDEAEEDDTQLDVDSDADENSSDEEITSEEDNAEDEEITSAESGEEDIGIQGTEQDDKEKSQAVVEQLDLWDRLMEARIQLQKTLSVVNKIPCGAQGGPMQHEAQAVLDDLSCSLCGLHRSKKSSPRKRKAETTSELLATENFTSYQSVRNDTVTFWDDKTRLASKKFKSFNSFNTSVLKQVEQILSDRDRLVRRTRVLRDADAEEGKPEEIFDDNDFYQRLLRQLVEHKASDAETSASTQSQWLEIQKLRVTKKKKDVDTRASKGRKLRYNVHSKMVNFMAPRDDSVWSEDAKNELFQNLFKMPLATEG